MMNLNRNLKYGRKMVGMILAVLLMGGLLVSLTEPVASAPASSVVPVNPNAMQKTKDLYQYLFNLRNQTKKQLVGQMIGFPEDQSHFLFSDVYKATGKWPAMMMVDYEDGWNDINLVGGVDYVNPNAAAIHHWKHGGIVTVSWHPHHPLNDMTLDAPISEQDFRNLVIPGTTAYTKWHGKLDQIAEGLMQLQDRGIPVIWRPLHEFEGDWAWWQSKPAADYIAVYRDMFDYFTTVKGLNNLLWTWTPNFSNTTTDLSYPGDMYVDIVGFDVYCEDTYTYANTKYGASKVLAATEKGGHCNVYSNTNLAFYNNWLDNIGPDQAPYADFAGYLSLKHNDPIGIMNLPVSVDRASVGTTGGTGGSGAIESGYGDTFEGTVSGSSPANWQDGDYGGGIGTWRVEMDGSNRVYKPLTVTSHAVSSLSVMMDTVNLEADVKPISHNASGSTYLAVRWNDSNHNILAGYNYTTGQWEIRENMGLANMNMVRASVAGTLTDGTIYKLRVVAYGNTVLLFVDGQLKLSADVKKYYGGQVAFVTDNQNVSFDNMTVHGTMNTSANLAIAKKVTASSAITTGTFNPRYLTNNVEQAIENYFIGQATSWGHKSAVAHDSENHTEWVQIDLDSNTTFNQVRLFPRGDKSNVTNTGSPNFPVNFTIQVAPNGSSSFTTVKTITNQPNPNKEEVVYSFPTQSARYVRIVATKLGDSELYEPNIYRLGLQQVGIYNVSDTADIVNAGFEALNTENIMYGVFEHGWMFSKHSGTQANGSAFGAANAPEGSRTAFLQGESSISQRFYIGAGSHTISFQAARRSYGGQQTIEVYVGWTKVGTITPTSTNFSTFTTESFSIPQGYYPVTFVGVNNIGDNTAFIDDVQLQLQPQIHLINEGFNSQTDGAAPAGWTLNTSGGTVTVRSVPSAVEKSMRLQKSGSTGYAAGMKKFNPQTSGIVTYDAWVMAEETAGSKEMMVRNEDTSKIASIVSFADGQIKVNASTNVQTYVANQWYHIVLKLNQNNKTFDLYVDDVPSGTFDYFDSDTNDLGEVLFSIPPSNTGTFYVSDIKMSK